MPAIANRKKLTATLIERAKPGSEIRDTESPLCLRVSPAGAKSFTTRARIDGSSQQIRFTYRASARIENLQAARTWALEIFDMCRIGVDPRSVGNEQQRNSAAARSNSFESAVDSYIEKSARHRQRTYEETRRVLRTSCAAWLDRPVGEITKQDAIALIEGFLDEGKAGKAHVTLVALRGLFKWLHERDIVPANFMHNLPVTIGAGATRKRVYSDDEIKAIWTAADDKLAHDEGRFIKLLILLGVRKHELSGMRWSELDNPDEPTLWTIPNERTKSRKNKVDRQYYVPLPPLPQAVLKRLRHASHGNEFVFPGRAEDQPIDPGTWLRVKVQQHSGVNDWTFHGCRHTVATWMQTKGYTEFEIGLVLNHSGGGSVTAGYSHGYALGLKRKLLCEWSEHVHAVLLGAASHQPSKAA